MEVSLDKHSIYSSPAIAENDVSTDVECSLVEMNAKEQVEVSLTIPIMATTITRSFKKADGYFIKFEVRAEGLAIVQSATKQ